MIEGKLNELEIDKKEFCKNVQTHITFDNFVNKLKEMDINICHSFNMKKH